MTRPSDAELEAMFGDAMGDQGVADMGEWFRAGGAAAGAGGGARQPVRVDKRVQDTIGVRDDRGRVLIMICPRCDKAMIYDAWAGWMWICVNCGHRHPPGEGGEPCPPRS